MKSERQLSLPGPAAERKIRSLVVGDSPFMLKNLARILEEACGFELVGTATDGWQALRHVSASAPELVLMDFHLPHLNGIRATQYMKGLEHPPIVIIITSDDTPVLRSLAKRAGADGFIVKGARFRPRLMGTLQDLFGPSGGRRAAASGISFQNPPAGQPNQDHGT